MGVFDRQILTAQRLIEKYGQLVVWRQYTVTTPVASEPWNKTNTPVNNEAWICFLPLKQETKKTLQALTGNEIPTGQFYGLMGAVNFIPSPKDKVIRDSKEITVKDFKILNPNGQIILYTIGFEV